MTLRLSPLELVLLLTVGLALPASLGSAQPAVRCDTCVVSNGCESTRTSCIAECRARLFSVDPNRSECLDACARKAIACTRTADTSCKSQKAC